MTMRVFIFGIFSVNVKGNISYLINILTKNVKYFVSEFKMSHWS